MLELKLSRSPRRDFACLIIWLFCDSELIEKEEFFPSISVKIDLKEAWKRLLLCEESESQHQLPANFHLSHPLLLAYSHLAYHLEMFTYR